MNVKIALISLGALAVSLVYALVVIIENRSPDDPEALYREQVEQRGVSGKIKRPVVPVTVNKNELASSYDQKVGRIIPKALSKTVVVASWYGGDDGFVGKCKANGEFFDDGKFTVAHRELPLGTLVALERGGKFALAMVTDRGPYVEGRDLDVSRAIADRLGIGVSPVTMFVLRVPEKNVMFHRDNPRCLKV